MMMKLNKLFAMALVFGLAACGQSQESASVTNETESGAAESTVTAPVDLPEAQFAGYRVVHHILAVGRKLA